MQGVALMDKSAGRDSAEHDNSGQANDGHDIDRQDNDTQTVSKEPSVNRLMQLI